METSLRAAIFNEKSFLKQNVILVAADYCEKCSNAFIDREDGGNHGDCGRRIGGEHDRNSLR